MIGPPQIADAEGNKPKPKKKKVKEEEKSKAVVETASQEVNTVLVMPKSKKQTTLLTAQIGKRQSRFTTQR